MSKASLASLKAVKPRMSRNSTAATRTTPAACSPSRKAGAAVSGFRRRVTLRACRGRIWQARRTSASAPMRASSADSASDGGASPSPPSSTLTRQVEQRALPPQTERCGTRWARLISSRVGPGAVSTFGPGS